jgi:endonuclease/exonuclease/phosphatase (EEP) superfamily protein YafD
MSTVSPPKDNLIEVPPLRRRNVWRQLLMGASVAGMISIAAIHWLQPDSCAALTAIPPWCWLIAFVGIAAVAVRRVPNWQRWAFLLMAGGFSLLVVEQVGSYARSARGMLFDAAHHDRSFRAVTLNCNAGSKLAAFEVLRLRPDVLLLQESPNHEAVQELAEKLFGSEGAMLWSADCSIVARGKLEAGTGSSRHFVHASWTRVDGQTVGIYCIRLTPPVVNYALWSPSCWREHAAARRQHRLETGQIARVLAETPSGRPILLGGDCNCPAGDGALGEWYPRLQDAFNAAGQGWGMTVLNRIPVLRFDQLWSSAEVRPLAVWAEGSEHSDHRMVVGDFEVTNASAP